MKEKRWFERMEMEGECLKGKKQRLCLKEKKNKDWDRLRAWK